MAEPDQANPIQIRSLLDNAWVFGMFGLVNSLLIFGMSITKVEIDYDKMRNILMEPFSIYCFSILSSIGLLSLLIAQVTVANTGAKMKASWWVGNIWVPIANAGLSAGAAITGLCSGMLLALYLVSPFDSGVKQLLAPLLMISIYMLLLIVPMAWMMRSMFDETEREKNISSIVGIFYCGSLSAYFWIVNSVAFWTYILSASGLSLLAIIFMYVRKR